MKLYQEGRGEEGEKRKRKEEGGERAGGGEGEHALKSDGLIAQFIYVYILNFIVKNLQIKGKKKAQTKNEQDPKSIYISTNFCAVRI